MSADPVPTPAPVCKCGNPETTHDRYGTDACATCRLASELMATAFVDEIAALLRGERETPIVAEDAA